MTKLRVLVLIVPLSLVLASFAFASEESPTQQGPVTSPGPSRPESPTVTLVERLGIEQDPPATIPDGPTVLRGDNPRPRAAEMQLRDRSGLATGSGKPNIVWIVTDDMALSDLSVMPAVRKLLGDQGTTFDQALSRDSICCPARATLMTGRAAHNHRTVGNRVQSMGGWQVFEHFNDPNDLLPVWLQQAGYRTWSMGKYLNGYAGDDANVGWDYFYVPMKGQYAPYEWTAAVNGRSVGYEGWYQQEILTRYATEDLATFAERDEPFFMFVQTLAPHTMMIDGEWQPPLAETKYRNTVPRVLAPRLPSTQESDVSDKPPWVSGLPRSTINRPEWWAQRLESLKSVDDMVADMVAQAKRSGIYDDTIFVFTSDNGFNMGEHRYWGKNRAYEESARIPLVIAGPGFEAGARVSQQVSLEDVVATTVRASGSRPAWPLDGVPLQGFDTDPALHADRPMLLEGSVAGFPKAGALPVDEIGRFYRAVRWRGWKVVHYETGDREMYDLARDPYELVNVYNGRRAPEQRRARILAVQRRLERWMAKQDDCVGAECAVPPGQGGPAPVRR